jgi:hypothetical protein
MKTYRILTNDLYARLISATVADCFTPNIVYGLNDPFINSMVNKNINETKTNSDRISLLFLL